MGKRYAFVDEDTITITNEMVASALKEKTTSTFIEKIANSEIRSYWMEFDNSAETKEGFEPTAKLHIQLMPNLEYIDLSFKVTPEGIVDM